MALFSRRDENAMKIKKDTAIGTMFSGKKAKILDESRVLVFSGGRFNMNGWPAKNIHTDVDFARKVGMSTRAVSATQYQSYVVELMIDLFGESWFKHGKMNLKFIAIVNVGERLITEAIVSSRESEGSYERVYLDVWCVNQDGNKVVVGTASGIVE